MGLKLVFAILGEWIGGLRAEFGGPALAGDALPWIRSSLDAEAAGLAELLTSPDDDSATMLHLLEDLDLDLDLLPAMIWLTAAITATRDGGDPTWLRRYESR